jgi:hypothetical protein
MPYANRHPPNSTLITLNFLYVWALSNVYTLRPITHGLLMNIPDRILNVKDFSPLTSGFFILGKVSVSYKVGFYKHLRYIKPHILEAE